MAVVDKPSCKVSNQAYSWLALDEITKNIWGGKFKDEKIIEDAMYSHCGTIDLYLCHQGC